MGLFKGAMVFAAMALAAPVWAHGGGHGYDRGWYDSRERGHHHRWDRDDHRREGRHYRNQHQHWDRTPRSYSYYNQHYYAPPPVYGYVAPAPGVHIVAPNVYIPFR